MSGLWKVWFGVLAAAGLYGLVLLNDASTAADLNDLLASSAPQQTVSALWGVRDLLSIVVLELIVLVLTVASIGLRPATKGVVVTSGSVVSDKPEIAQPDTVEDGRHSVPSPPTN